MGIFGNGNNNQGGNFCNCPHCRGSHEDNLGGVEEGYSFGNHFDEGVEFESNELSYADENTITPEELVSSYVEEIAYGNINSVEELSSIMFQFYQDVALYAVKETHLADVENKITILNILKKNGM